MGLVFQRGQIENLATEDQKGSATCSIDNKKVSLHPALNKVVSQGDEVFIAGRLDKKSDTLKAYAVNNITQRRIASVDSALYILLMGLGFYAAIFFSVVGMKEENELLQSLEYFVAIAGLVTAAVTIRTAVLINKASNGVNYP